MENPLENPKRGSATGLASARRQAGLIDASVDGGNREDPEFARRIIETADTRELPVVGSPDPAYPGLDPVVGSPGSTRPGLDTATIRELTEHMLPEGPGTVPMAVIASRRVADTGLVVSPLGLAASRLVAVDDETARAVLSRFADDGGTFIDLASRDGGERAELLVGDWLRANPHHDRIVLQARVRLGRDRGAASLIKPVNAALSRLGVARIDVLALDFSSFAQAEVSMEDVLTVAETLVSRGIVGYLGAVNANPELLLQARMLVATGLPRITTVLGDWDILHRSGFEATLHVVASQQKLAIFPDATASVARLTGPELPQKVLAKRLPTMLSAVMPSKRRGKEHRITDLLEAIAAENGVEPVSVALAWLLAKRGVAAPVVGVGRPEQLASVMEAAMLRLNRTQMLDLNRVSE